ncbi:EAL domain-containing protein [Cohnella xylanilytica]|uniref:EAL domain-containing protein n=1 Tax=Cohnella xylanilytica TaxID=557555 RepID=A0A841TTU8_9BACL|nr:GGDEF domain-containing phosphodiesterase [Cohnella xylanilytica]MBB6691595.1 EAL domain-containing protein [Cohnella xylanilytica]
MNGWPDTSSYQLELLNSIYNSPVTIAVIDSQGLIVDVNRDPYDTFGCAKEELLGQAFADWLDEATYDNAVQAFRRTLAGETCTQNIRIFSKKGHYVDLSVNTAPLSREEETVGIVVSMSDISDHKRSLDRIRYMAYYDDMTGLPNRRYFANRLEEKLAESHRNGTLLAVCYLDVDRFKLVNASFGRDSGDMLLLQIAERLTRFFQSQDSLARMEGDEFAGLLTEVSGAEDVSARMDALIRLFEEPFELGGVQLHVTVSVGVTIGGGLEEDGGALLKKADAALYRAKENGRNDYQIYTSDFEHKALHKLTLHHEMMNALQNGEFLLYYQPQYDLATGRIVGLEALVRWKHPVRGLVPPGEFIPAAEESGIIVPLGEWVLQEACRQNKEWQDAGMPPIPVSVNLSVRQFTQRNLIGKIAGALERSGLEPRYLKLEITESMTMDVERALSFLQELKELGVGISIDDFGTGYSSFHYLRNFPIGSLKIDRSFVRDIGDNPNNAAIVAAIIAMAHNLQLQVIAEGVETLEQVRFLQQHGCDEMQGYYGSPPLPCAGVASLMEAVRNRAALDINAASSS